MMYLPARTVWIMFTMLTSTNIAGRLNHSLKLLQCKLVKRAL